MNDPFTRVEFAEVHNLLVLTVKKNRKKKFITTAKQDGTEYNTEVGTCLTYLLISKINLDYVEISVSFLTKLSQY